MSSNGLVQIRDFSDREILQMILDLDAHGEITARDLARRVYGWSEIEREDKDKVSHGVRCCGARLAWMKRFGLVQRDKQMGLWRISDEGAMLIRSRMQADVGLAIRRAPDVRALDLANLVGERMVAAGPVAGTAMRRELQFQIVRRKRA